MKRPNTYTEAERVYDEWLLALLRSGDRRAAERLAVRWYPRLLRTARRLLGDEDQAVEATQEAWLGICRGWQSLKDPAKFPAWAYRIIHRKCTDRIRQEIKHRNRAADIAQPSAQIQAPQGEDKIALRQAFAELSPEHRWVAILYFSEGLTVTEIAIATQIPLGTAKSRIFHARQNLKAALSGDIT